MKGDLHPCALRLMQSLPVRTHERKTPERVNLGNPLPARGKSVIFGKGGRASPVIVCGQRFESATEAAKSLHKSTSKIYDWLRSGEARYV